MIDAFTPLGALAKHARAIRAAARVANKLESLAEAPYEDAATVMHAVPGIGPWTSALTLAMVQGHPDAVPLNDLHLPREVSWALVGEREADLYVVDSCLDPAGAHRALLAVEDLATALSAADVVGEVYVGDVLAFPELVRQACHEAVSPVVARLAAALKGLVYASATPPALRLVRAAGGDGDGGDPNGE